MREVVEDLEVEMYKLRTRLEASGRSGMRVKCDVCGFEDKPENFNAVSVIEERIQT